MSWRILLDCRITELPVRISSVCNILGVSARLYTPDNDSDGECRYINGKPVIFVSSLCGVARQRFTVAHELGHLMLGHVGQYGLVNRDPAPQDNPIEQAANVFASRLLAPACVLWGCGVKTADDIVKLCDISKAAAEFRMERMEELYRRDKFLISPMEKAVYEQFSGYISKHRL